MRRSIPAIRRSLRYVACALALVLPAMVAHAAAPGLAFNPNRDDIPPAPDVDSGTPSFEVTFSGANASIAISASPAGTGTDTFDTTTLFGCQVIGSGSSGMQLGPLPPNVDAVGIRGDGTNVDRLTRTLPLVCAQTAQAQVGYLQCLVKNGPQNGSTVVWDLRCPGTGPTAPQFSSSPAGSTSVGTPTPLPVIVTPKGVIGTATIGVTNLGGSTLNVTGTLANSGGGLVLAPLTTAMLLSTQSLAYTVQCTGTTSGDRFGQATLASNDAARPNNYYQVSCTITGAEFDASLASGAPIALAAGIGQPAQQSITLRNLGNVDLTLGAPGGLSGRLSATIVPQTLAQGASGTLSIVCDTSTSGSSGMQTLTFSTNDSDAGQGSIGYPVSCEVAPAAAPEFAASLAPPGPITLTNVAGQPTKTLVVTISNQSTNATLNLTNLSALSAPLSGDLSMSAISPSGSATLTFGCGSAGAVNTTQTLSFNTDDPTGGESSITYDVSCNVSAAPLPRFASTPAAPGPVNVVATQGASGSTNLVFRNAGDATLTLGVLIQPMAPFTAVSVPAMLAAGASSSVPIGCNATSVAAGNYTGSLTLSTNDGGVPLTPFTFNLNCTVLAPVFGSTPAVPGPLSITTVQGTDGQATLSMRNTGNAPLVVSSVMASAAPFSVLPPANATVQPGATRDFVVRCAAGNVGDFAATLNGVHNGTGGGASYNLTCRVRTLAPGYASIPGPGSGLGLGTQQFRTVTASLFVSNTGTANLSVSASGLSGELSISPPSAVIGPGSTRILVVACAANAIGLTSQTLTMASNASGAPFLYPVTCSIGAPPPPLPAGVLGALLAFPVRLDELFDDGFE